MFFATFFEKKGGAKKLSIRKFLELHNALWLYWQKVRALFFEANSTLRLLCAKGGGTRQRDGGIVFVKIFRLSPSMCHRGAKSFYRKCHLRRLFAKEDVTACRDGGIVLFNYLLILYFKYYFTNVF